MARVNKWILPFRVVTRGKRGKPYTTDPAISNAARHSVDRTSKPAAAHGVSRKRLRRIRLGVLQRAAKSNALTANGANELRTRRENQKLERSLLSLLPDGRVHTRLRNIYVSKNQKKGCLRPNVRFGTRIRFCPPEQSGVSGLQRA